ncbi:MAG: patatin family protein [Oscillospiraceae bacterium]|nr:patatin family protein [Oscillospiraceae bacterium]
MKTALIMEGGAMRGMFTCGVIDVFLERGVEFDGAAGISAGATFGINYKSRQPGRALRYNLKYSRDPRYCGLRSLLRTGDLYGADFCYRELPEVLDPFDHEAFEKNPMEFWVGATDVRTGKLLYHRCTDGYDEDIAWIRGSASMPLVSRPVAAGNRLLLDGGIVEPLPLHFMEKRGYDRNVLILTRAKGYRKKPTPLLLPMRLALGEYPKVAEALELRPWRYNARMEEIDRREKAGELLVLRPPEDPGVGRTEKNPRELERVYRMGREEALKRLAAVKAWISG